MLIRPEAKLIFDNPDAQGRIELHGFGYEWVFEARRQEQALQPGTYTPTWDLCGGTEIVPGLNALSLRGSAPPESMAQAGWTVMEGTWRIEWPDWHPRCDWLMYVSPSGGSGHGRIRTVAPLPPRIAFHIIDYVPPAGWTGDSYTCLAMLGDGSVDHGYYIYLPLHSDTYKWPLLFRGAYGDWRLVEEFQRVDMAGDLETQGVRRTSVWVEETDGAILIRMSGASEPWIYYPPEGHLQGLVSGPVEVGFIHHTGLCNTPMIRYPESGLAVPLDYIDIPIDCATTPHAVVSENAMGGPSAEVAWDTRGEDQVRPQITLRTDDVHKRPVVYVVHQYHEAELTARPMATPINTQTRATALIAAGQDSSELVSLRWRRGLWRDWLFDATLRDPHDYWSGMLKPNMKVTASAGWDGSQVALMTGYLSRPKPTKRAGEERGQVVYWELEARDYLMARLADKKFLLQNCSPEGWDLGAWATWQLRKAGCGLTVSFPSGTTVQHGLMKEIQWRGSPDTALLPMMDEVFRAHGWVPLAIDADNVVWSGPEPTYSGTPDFVLNEAAATGDDLIRTIDAELEDNDHRNCIAGVNRDGDLARVMQTDGYQNPASANFLGDDWWAAEDRADLSRDQLAAWAIKELEERLRTRQVLTWERLAAPAAVWPGAFVKVTVNGLGVPANTVMRIISDEGYLAPETLEGWGVYVAELV